MEAIAELEQSYIVKGHQYISKDMQFHMFLQTATCCIALFVCCVALSGIDDAVTIYRWDVRCGLVALN